MTIDQDLYKEIIFDHADYPRFNQPILGANAKIDLVNRSCGDVAHLEIRLVKDRLEAISCRVNGCLISVASGSLMCERVINLRKDQIRLLIDRITSIIGNHSDEEITDPELQAIVGVRKYPNRQKCAILPWQALEQLIDNKSKNQAKNNEQNR